MTPTHSAHMWSLREIECDITLGLYYPALVQDAASNLTSSNHSDSWYETIRVRLEGWYQAIRQSVNLTEKIEFHEVLYQGQVLRLNRRSPRFPAPTKEMRRRAIKASIALIKEFSVLDRLGKMFMIWHATYCIVEAGVYLLLSILTGIETQSPDRRTVGDEDINILTRYVKTFPSLLRKISRRWPSIVPIAISLETISISVTENVQEWTDGHDLSNSAIVSLKEKLQKATIFSSQDGSLSNLPPPLPEADQYQTAGATSSQVGGLAQPATTIFDPSSYQLPPANVEAVSASSGWLGNQPGLDPTLGMFPDSYSVDYGDPMAWDFPGVESEEIFAALLEGWQGDSQMATMTL